MIYKIIVNLIIFIIIILYLNFNKYSILINKDNKINDYNINDLILINNKYLRKEAYLNFIKLQNDAKELGYYINITSAYRDYNYQNKLFNYYVKYKGLNYALNCCGKPGYSEHHTGLAIDVEGSNKNYNKFDESKEFNWMINNSYKYGFILRYPKGKEHITKYKFEPWHYRFVGVKLACFLHKYNLTLEEYKKILN